jgi:hypothetical protein
LPIESSKTAALPSALPPVCTQIDPSLFSENPLTGW